MLLSVRLGSISGNQNPDMLFRLREANGTLASAGKRAGASVGSKVQKQSAGARKEARACRKLSAGASTKQIENQREDKGLVGYRKEPNLLAPELF